MFRPVRLLSSLLLLLGSIHPVAFAQVPHTRWYLAEGATTPFFEDEVIVANPNGFAVNLTVTFLPEVTSSVQKAFTVPATSRLTIKVNDHVPNDAVSVIVDATAEVLVERSMYWPAGSRRGGSHSNAVEAPSTNWYFAEGSTNIFQEFVLIANPSATTAANVEITFLRDGGQLPITVAHSVAPLKRKTVWVNAELAQLGSASFSTTVRSTNGVPVLAERAMYWSNFEGGHNATGLTSPARSFRFAEGYTGGTFQTFLLLANPGATPANALVTFFPETGSPVVHPVTVGANSRETVWVNALPIDPKGSFSMLVQSDVDIVAERAMYWDLFVDGHSTAGSPVEATTWGFAEGLEDAHGGIEYDSYFLFVNSSGSDATIKGTFYREDGTGFSDTFTVPANKRYTLIPARYPQLTYQKFASFFQSLNNVPVVAERAVYWGNGYFGGHASLGTPWNGAVAAPPAPAPVSVTSISPGAGPTTGGTSVTISGDNFTRGTSVTIGGIGASNVQVTSEKTLVARTGARPAGTVDVVVTSDGKSATLPGAFTFEEPPVAPPPPPPPTEDPGDIDLGKVVWLHTNVSSWARTSTITGVDITRDQICVYHTKAGQWPRTEFGDEDPIEVEGNVWIFAYVNGKWYAATYDWLRPGQECKNVTGPELGVDQIRYSAPRCVLGAEIGRPGRVHGQHPGPRRRPLGRRTHERARDALAVVAPGVCRGGRHESHPRS